MKNNDSRDPAASLGSHGEPIGWQGTDEFGLPSGFLSWRDDETRWPKSQTVPLYLAPQPTLTDEEREAIAWCVGMAETTATECDEELAALRGLLDRTK